MGMNELLLIKKQDVIRILILLVSSLVLSIIVNAMHPARLPLLLSEGKRPAIPTWAWNELRYTDARVAFEKVSTGHGILIDVRERDAFCKSHAVGAINLPYREFEDAYPDFAKDRALDQPLFIFCQGTLCGISIRVAKHLLELGFKNLIVIKQDFEAWKESNLPVEYETQQGGGQGGNEKNYPDFIEESLVTKTSKDWYRMSIYICRFCEDNPS